MSTTTTALASSYSGLSNFTTNSLYPIDNAYTNTSSSTYARLNVSKKNTTGSVYFEGFDFSAIPEKATITSVSILFKGNVSNTSRITGTSVQAYKNSAASGSTSSFTSTSASVYTIDAGTWTREELNSFKIYVTATRGSTNLTSYINIYGIEVSVVWEEPEQTQKMSIRMNGSWTSVLRAFTRTGGAWVEVNDLSSIDTTKKYVRGD